ncbi:Yke2 [Kluyveromyces lactis]|nr:Yke2 [Kluyveromyces lactis]
MSAEETTQKYTKLQGELEELIVARQKLETQLQENKIVSDEFSSLKDDVTVYKLTGGVLLPVEQFEAKGNVEKRLEFIETEIKRCETNIKSKQQELELARSELMKLRSQQQQQQQQ